MRPVQRAGTHWVHKATGQCGTIAGWQCELGRQASYDLMPALALPYGPFPFAQDAVYAPSWGGDRFSMYIPTPARAGNIRIIEDELLHEWQPAGEDHVHDYPNPVWGQLHPVSLVKRPKPKPAPQPPRRRERSTPRKRRWARRAQ